MAAGMTGPQRHGGHRWMMIACCIPTLLMAVMMRGIDHAGGGQ